MNNNPDNPLKSQGQTKATTRAASDQAQPTGIRPKTIETATGAGGSRAVEPGRHADTAHPSQHGGVKADDPTASADRPGVKRAGPSPADEPSSPRTGTAPDRSGGPTRSGKTDGRRQL